MIKEIKSLSVFGKDLILDIIKERKLAPKVSKKEIKVREEICKQCDEFFRDKDKIPRCNQCGCNMNIKFTYKASRCPLRRW